MTIAEDLQNELRDAMRARDQRRLDVIRQIRSEVSRAVSEPGFRGEADDDLHRSVIAGYVKKMSKAVEEYRAAGARGADQAAKLEFEIEFLERWLPPAVSEEETRQLVRSTIDDLGVHDAKEAGRVVGAIMKSGRAGLDGALVNRLVREELSA